MQHKAVACKGSRDKSASRGRAGPPPACFLCARAAAGRGRETASAASPATSRTASGRQRHRRRHGARLPRGGEDHQHRRRPLRRTVRPGAFHQAEPAGEVRHPEPPAPVGAEADDLAGHPLGRGHVPRRQVGGGGGLQRGIEGPDPRAVRAGLEIGEGMLALQRGKRTAADLAADDRMALEIARPVQAFPERPGQRAGLGQRADMAASALLRRPAAIRPGRADVRLLRRDFAGIGKEAAPGRRVEARAVGVAQPGCPENWPGAGAEIRVVLRDAVAAHRIGGEIVARDVEPQHLAEQRAGILRDRQPRLLRMAVAGGQVEHPVRPKPTAPPKCDPVIRPVALSIAITFCRVAAARCSSPFAVKVAV